MRYLLLIPLLAGCATTKAGLAERDVLATYQSAKEPRDLADCLSRTVTMTQVEPNGAGFITYRRNPYGVSMTQYDVQPSGNGSTVQIKANISAAAGLDKVSACL